MKKIIEEIQKLNPKVTSEQGVTRFSGSVWGAPFIETVIIDVHGAKVQDIKMPEDCIFVPCLSYEGVHALVKRADGSEATCYIKGIEPISWAKWMDDYYSRIFHL